MDIRSLPSTKLALALVTAASMLALSACQQQPSPTAAPAAATAAAPAPAPYVPPSAEQLYKLVAPIALFPDKLLAQTLAASVYPDQVGDAQGWLRSNSGLAATDRLKAAAAQPWDPSVKALTAFPDVIDQLASNGDWTRALGDAYAHDPNEVLDAIQVMRGRAQAQGHLRSTPQQRVQMVQRTVVEPAYADERIPPPRQTIVIEPAQPDVVYVPRYDPDVVYGAPVDVYREYRYHPRYYSEGDLVTAGIVSFGVGVLVGDALEHRHHGPLGWLQPEPAWHPWGWNSWGMNWNAPPSAPHYVVYQNRVYAPRTTIINNNITNNISNNRIDARRFVHNDNRSFPQQAALAAMPAVATAAALAPHLAQNSRGPAAQFAPAAAAAPRHALDYAQLSTPHFNERMLQPGRPVVANAAQRAPLPGLGGQNARDAGHDARAQPAFAQSLHAPMPMSASDPRHAMAMANAAAVQRRTMPQAPHANAPMPMGNMQMAHAAPPHALSMPAPHREDPRAQQARFAQSEHPRQAPHQFAAFTAQQQAPAHREAPMRQFPERVQAMPRQEQQRPPMQEQHMARIAPPRQQPMRAAEPRPAPRPAQAHSEPHHEHDKHNG
ncbi:DUF3300 domain-containing protein [Xanthomonas translucens]|uniref:DUF3300 domain-containing protein n=4 Tax=Xanthomonas campestris pv. translucens TaxID=343 RepID=UPI00071E89C4|nr:DUF3300 domain-containing protein [Xanthomonas translucens]UKE59929.1 DUF3300 domain-containing protein [Xanthomonas translucens pv. hordei]KTF39979.1 hypothetical protein OZ12_09310 [Xanthomonas translucens pv. translucens]MQS41708.1 DUF3300 domain-containing protein [Xanthomonas translucens pv. translucens]QSQ39341.1 DUF3300 domain-containing protein [Xanthomonas translucens pv. translucens]UNU12704.1 DUF3300 domain-containing protein [Xanthomonas translucens pv. translucens]